MRRRKPNRNLTASQVLEDRALLAATLTDGVLTIEGTEEADIIKIRLVQPEVEEGELEAADPVLVVQDNEETLEFAPEDVQSFVITSGEGDDKIKIGRDIDTPAEVDAGAGDDRVRTGGGDDVVLLGEGNDRAFTADGNDNVDAGDGDDRVGGGRGGDTLFGGLGSDRIAGGRGADQIDGGDGDDAVRGDADDDTLIGGGGNDKLSAGSGINDLNGGDGNDTLFGNSDNDSLEGGEGDNQIIDQVEIINEFVDAAFAQLDTNENDLLDSEDGTFTSLIVSRLAEDYDADEDGSISRDELATAAGDRATKFLQRLDGDRDGRGRKGGRGHRGGRRR